MTALTANEAEGSNGGPWDVSSSERSHNNSFDGRKPPRIDVMGRGGWQPEMAGRGYSRRMHHPQRMSSTDSEATASRLGPFRGGGNSRGMSNRGGRGGYITANRVNKRNDPMGRNDPASRDSAPRDGPSSQRDASGPREREMGQVEASPNRFFQGKDGSPPSMRPPQGDSPSQILRYGAKTQPISPSRRQFLGPKGGIRLSIDSRRSPSGAQCLGIMPPTDYQPPPKHHPIPTHVMPPLHPPARDSRIIAPTRNAFLDNQVIGRFNDAPPSAGSNGLPGSTPLGATTALGGTQPLAASSGSFANGLGCTPAHSQAVMPGGMPGTMGAANGPNAMGGPGGLANGMGGPGGLGGSNVLGGPSGMAGPIPLGAPGGLAGPGGLGAPGALGPSGGFVPALSVPHMLPEPGVLIPPGLLYDPVSMLTVDGRLVGAPMEVPQCNPSFAGPDPRAVTGPGFMGCNMSLQPWAVLYSRGQSSSHSTSHQMSHRQQEEPPKPPAKITYSVPFMLSLRHAPLSKIQPLALMNSLSPSSQAPQSTKSHKRRQSHGGSPNYFAHPETPTWRDQQTPVHRPEKVSTKEQQLRRSMKGLLNKLTVEKFVDITESMVKHILESVETSEHLEIVIDETFKKAVMEPNFSELYADLCLVLRARCPSFPPTEPNGKPYDFARGLIMRCQKEFEQIHDFAKLVLSDEEKKGMSEDDIECERKIRKTRTLGNVRFIGELFTRRIITNAALHCILLPIAEHEDPPEAHLIECMCELLTTIGYAIERSAPSLLERLLNRMKSLRHSYEKRIEFKILNLIELQEDEWKQRMVYRTKALALSDLRAASSKDEVVDIAGQESNHPYKSYVHEFAKQWNQKKAAAKLAKAAKTDAAKSPTAAPPCPTCGTTSCSCACACGTCEACSGGATMACKSLVMAFQKGEGRDLGPFKQALKEFEANPEWFPKGIETVLSLVSEDESDPHGNLLPTAVLEACAALVPSEGSVKHLEQALKRCVENLPEASVDKPSAPTVLGRVIASLIHQDRRPATALKDGILQPVRDLPCGEQARSAAEQELVTLMSGNTDLARSRLKIFKL